MLRAKTPDPVEKRLKLFMYGPAGVGKTTAAIQFPRAYVIDCERGTENYDKLLTRGGSAVLQTTEMADVVAEVQALLTEPHDYRTLVIDPISTVYNDLVDRCEATVGNAHGRHYGEANKQMKRLANLINALDMNVIVTAHGKKEYGDNMKVTGQTFDGWRQLDYWFDLVVELQKAGKRRTARVAKTRIEAFPDGEVIDWSYEKLCDRYGKDILERRAVATPLASEFQINELLDLLGHIRLPDGTTTRWLAKAGVDRFEDMTAEQIGKCIEYVRNRRPAMAAAG